MNTLPDYDTPMLARAVEALPADDVDRLPFGVIRIAADGRVLRYSATEAAQSGRGARPVIGLDFFVDIAPCMDTPAFRGRIERAIAAGTLDLEFGHVGDFADRDRALRVRVQSASTGGFWLFLSREDG